MSYPLIAKLTYEKHAHDPHYKNLVEKTFQTLLLIPDSHQRTEFIHSRIDQEVAENLEDPFVKDHLACRKGCNHCCYSEVGITEDEAETLTKEIDKGVFFDEDLLKVQNAHKRNGGKWIELAFEKRRCPFLGRNGLCSVYENRPSVCRTNNALLSDENCRTDDGTEKKKHLVKTIKANMLIMAFFAFAQSTGTLAEILTNVLKRKKNKDYKESRL